MADRIGRANMVVVGLLVVGLVTFFGIPAAHTKATYALAISVIGFFEGMVLVATPALVRDFSPQQRRGAAMGFWTLGPVLGSLTVSLVASQTLDHLHAWQDQFRIAGAVGLVVFLVALLFLRELAPGLRDQIMTSLRERVLAEVRSRGMDVERALKRPFRQMLGCRHRAPRARGQPLPPHVPGRRRLLRHLLRLGVRLHASRRPTGWATGSGRRTPWPW